MVLVDGEQVKWIKNLNEELTKIIGLLGREYENTIFERGPAECRQEGSTALFNL